MPIVTFWSNSEKTTGQTVSAAAAATVMAMDHNYKTILISVDIDNHRLEKCFGEQQSNKALVRSLISGPQINIDTGVQGLLKLAKSNRVTPDTVKDYTKIIYKNRLEVLYSSSSKEIPAEEQLECFRTIILNASKYYDYVFVDLKKGLYHSKILDILDLSSAIVLTTEQTADTLQEFARIKEMQKYIRSGKILWTISKYDRHSKYNEKNLTRTIWKKQEVYAIPYNTLLFEATNEGMLADVLLRFKTIKTEDENIELLEEIARLNEAIIRRCQETQGRI